VSIEARLLDIARPLLPSVPELPSDEALRVERDLAAALDAQIAGLPLYLAAPFRAALVAFELAPLLRFGRPYRALPIESQRRVVRAWSNAPIGAFRNFIKLVRSCALYAYLDHPIVTERLERDSATPDRMQDEATTSDPARIQSGSAG
jgi:hypothetical protein